MKKRRKIINPPATIIIKKINNSYIQVKCQYALSEKLKDRYSYYDYDYRYKPSFKQGIWDGKIYLFDIETGYLPIGFALDVYKFIKSKYSDVIVDFGIFNEGLKLNQQDVVEYCESIGAFTPYDHQLEMVLIALKKTRCIFEAATNAGKSFSMFLICQFLRMYEEEERILIIVPTSQLVEQMSSDFCQYIENYDRNFHKNINKLYKGNKYDPEKRITVATWQTLQHKSEKFMEQFTTVIVDEAHSAESGMTLQNIVSKCVNCVNKFGFSGSFSDETIHQKQLNGLFGPVIRIITARELIDLKMAAEFDITTIVLDYSQKRKVKLRSIIDSIPKSVYNYQIKRYQAEVKFISECPEKIKFISKLASNSNKNTILMFKSIPYGKQLFREIKRINNDKRVYYIDGTILTAKRTEIISNLETYNNCILVGSFKTISTGINIKNVYNVVLTESLKASKTLIQTIGRILRLCGEDKKASLFDLVDNLQFKGKNFALKHYGKRKEIYKKEGHKITKVLKYTLKE